MFANLAPLTVGEASSEWMDLWRPAMDRELEGSVCSNSPGNADADAGIAEFGVSGSGTLALGRTGPAAAASFIAGSILEDLDATSSDGIFRETRLLDPRVLRLDLPRPLAKYRRLGCSDIARLGTLTSMPSANGPVRIDVKAVDLGLEDLCALGRDGAGFRAKGRGRYASSPNTAMQMSFLRSGTVSEASPSFTRPSITSISERSSIVVGFRRGDRYVDDLLDRAGNSSLCDRGISERRRRKRVHKGKVKWEMIEKETDRDVKCIWREGTRFTRMIVGKSILVHTPRPW